jgi:hypothetical protein
MSGLSLVKRALKGGLGSLGLELRRTRPPGAAGRGKGEGRYSNFDEEGVLRALLDKVRPASRFCVDIGAGDGETSSNTCFLLKEGWQGLSVEWDGGRFALMAHRYAGLKGTRLLRARVTPGNVLALLSGAEVPREFGFLSLDIDSYDHFVLDRILSEYKPSVLCAEINEKVPPPVRFTVKWAEDHAWSFDHFYGQSLSILDDLGRKRGYVLAALEYNNAFLVPEGTPGVEAINAETAYAQGYLDRPDRLERLPWNKDMEECLALGPEEKAEFIRKKFEKYAGRFLCSTRPFGA